MDQLPSSVASENSEVNDIPLVEAARRGDQEAFRQLYIRHVQPCYWLAHSIVRNVQDAEDVVQDAFFTCYKKLHSIEIFGESLLPWLLVTTKFTALNRVRTTKRRQEITGTELPEIAAEDGDVTDNLEYQEALAAISVTVSRLGELDQKLFQSCIVDHKSYDDAAREYGVSVGSVRNRLVRIRKKIRAGLGN